MESDKTKAEKISGQYEANRQYDNLEAEIGLEDKGWTKILLSSLQTRRMREE